MRVVDVLCPELRASGVWSLAALGGWARRTVRAGASPSVLPFRRPPRQGDRVLDLSFCPFQMRVNERASIFGARVQPLMARHARPLPGARCADLPLRRREAAHRALYGRNQGVLPSRRQQACAAAVSEPLQNDALDADALHDRGETQRRGWLVSRERGPWAGLTQRLPAATNGGRGRSREPKVVTRRDPPLR